MRKDAQKQIRHSNIQIAACSGYMASILPGVCVATLETYAVLVTSTLCTANKRPSESSWPNLTSTQLQYLPVRVRPPTCSVCCGGPGSDLEAMVRGCRVILKAHRHDSVLRCGRHLDRPLRRSQRVRSAIPCLSYAELGRLAYANLAAPAFASAPH
jgi:hypothetical protein